MLYHDAQLPLSPSWPIFSLYQFNLIAVDRTEIPNMVPMVATISIHTFLGAHQVFLENE